TLRAVITPSGGEPININNLDAPPPPPPPAVKEADVVEKKGDEGRNLGRNRLKQVGLAFHNYHDQFKHFPTHAIYDKDGKTPLLSWRVAILPYLDQGELYQQFKLDEPWDSPNNKKLIAKMPEIYESLGMGQKGVGLTPYMVFTGPMSAFDGNMKLSFAQVPDGLSNTGLV